MKTTTIRLDDALVELIDRVAENTGQPASEVMRTVIREGLRTLADQDDKFRTVRDEIVQRHTAEQINAYRKKLGMDPIESPSD